MSRADTAVARRFGVAMGLALCAHVGLALGFSGAEPARPPPLLVTEIELAPPAEPEPVAKPEEPEPEQPDTKTTEPLPADAPARPRASASTPPPGRAGNVLTARADAPVSPGTEPVDFVTDPNGSSYAGGVVARGGSGDGGGHGAAPRAEGTRAAAPAPSGAAAKSDLTPASDLSRGPVLRGGTDCTGYYPSAADADAALVTLVVVVGPDGAIASLSVAQESPAGQGFGAAARACLRNGRFDPGLDEAGRGVKTATSVRVRFKR
ncbi:MAG: energy transducer TonB [Myxococcales bacterium]|nr:energy transducer TonB [Myxococcales bacterium]